MTTNPGDHTASATAAKQSRKGASRRKINLVLECTQAAIACTVVLATSVGVFVGRVVQKEAQVPFPAEWWTIVGLVIGFYFGHTNNARK